MYPENDSDFQDHTIEDFSNGSIFFDGGMGFFIPDDSPVTPRKGQTARFYGRGFGHTVRGLFVDGSKIFYRTEAEQKEHCVNLIYGKDAAEWLERWDAGKPVWSVSMGGIGPGYEQALQIAAAETVRRLITTQPDISDTKKAKRRT